MTLSRFCVFRRLATPLACAASLSLSQAAAQPAAGRGADIASAKETQQYCANIAASVEAARLERRQKQLAELEAQISTRIAALESKQTELRALLDRLEAFERKSNDALIGLYSRMKPESAAAQLAQLDDDMAAALMLQLKVKVSSAILSEMEAARGAAVARKISQMRASSEGKRP